MWKPSYRVTVDTSTGAIYIAVPPLDDRKVLKSREVAPGVLIDLDSAHQVIGVEILRPQGGPA